MGEPAWGHAQAPPPEHIRREATTRGTETSKYPEEEKSTEIALVAASERARAQTQARVSVQALPPGGCGSPARPTARGGEVTKDPVSGTAWKGRPQRVRAPYAKT